MEQVHLEPVSLRHADVMQHYVEDPAIGATTNVPTPYPSDGAARFIERMIEQRALGHDYPFVINADRKFVGVIALHDVVDGEATLGYWIGRPFWGKGYASSAARQIVDFGFRELHLKKIKSMCLVRNAESRRVLEKTGFRFTHEAPDPASKFAEEPFAWCEINADEWQESRS